MGVSQESCFKKKLQLINFIGSSQNNNNNNNNNNLEAPQNISFYEKT
jgi:hypothetical protein